MRGFIAAIERSFGVVARRGHPRAAGRGVRSAAVGPIIPLRGAWVGQTAPDDPGSASVATDGAATGACAGGEPERAVDEQETVDGVRVERDGGVATVVLDRPAAMNSMTTPTKVALLAALQDVADDAAVRCVVLTGTGRAFSVGQDLREHAQVLDSGDLSSLWSTVPTHYNPISRLLATMPKPVVAAVNGVAAGAGASFAMAADLRLVGASAGFNLAFTGIGLSADSGSTWYLPRLVGTGRAMDLLLRPARSGRRRPSPSAWPPRSSPTTRSRPGPPRWPRRWPRAPRSPTRRCGPRWRSRPRTTSTRRSPTSPTR